MIETISRFPPPWTVEDIGAAFVVTDSATAISASYPGGLYALAALEALSATDLNSAPVQALTLETWETAPDAAAAISAAMMASGSSASEMRRKSLSPVVK